MHTMIIAICTLLVLMPAAQAQQEIGSTRSPCPSSRCRRQIGLIAPYYGQPTFQGDGTWYYPSAGTGACGWRHGDHEHVAALSPSQYGSEPNPNNAAICGQCANVCRKGRCVKVMIADKCAGCRWGSIDLSAGAFKAIADPSAGRVPVTWSFVSC